MPGEDGLSLARHLREHSDVAIIMLTGSAEIIDRVVGLEVGADDYVAKPVDLRELLARVKAVLRRTSGDDEGAEKPEGQALQRCPVRHLQLLDLEAHKLFDAEGAEIAITPMEFQLLKVFAEHRGRILNRDQLLELAHDRGGTRSIAASISAFPACARRSNGPLEAGGDQDGPRRRLYLFLRPAHPGSAALLRFTETQIGFARQQARVREAWRRKSLLRHDCSFYAAFFFGVMRPRAMRSSAICTVLRAAPLRKLSETTHMERPFSTVKSSRMREI